MWDIGLRSTGCALTGGKMNVNGGAFCETNVKIGGTAHASIVLILGGNELNTRPLWSLVVLKMTLRSCPLPSLDGARVTMILTL